MSRPGMATVDSSPVHCSFQPLDAAQITGRSGRGSLMVVMRVVETRGSEMPTMRTIGLSLRDFLASEATQAPGDFVVFQTAASCPI